MQRPVVAAQPRVKKSRGVFYTPYELTKLLAGWAIQTRDDKILEPSFGGCGFLEVAVARLRELGCESPKKNLYGCDLDPSAFEYLAEKIGITDLEGRFIHANFLTIDRDSFDGMEFDVVIGNPPYVSHHNMDTEQKAISRNHRKSHKFQVSGVASLWAYFVMHGLMFLREDGRAAWVLPGSFFGADYSREVRSTLLRNFEYVAAFTMRRRYFLGAGTEETTVVVLCRGFNRGQHKTKFVQVIAEDTKELLDLISDWENDDLSGDVQDDDRFAALNDPKLLNLFSRLKEHRLCHALGALVQVRIGLVTGDNRFFVVDQNTADSNDLQHNSLKPIFSRQQHGKGLCVSRQDIETASNRGGRCWLVDTSELGEKFSPIRRYLASYQRRHRRNNCTFKKRSPWHAVDDGIIPDAFFSYMNNEGPRLILNTDGLNSTNNIHRVSFMKRRPIWRKKLIAVSICSSFTQLAAEMVGRTYSGGILKLEPSETRRLPVLIPDTVKRKKVVRTFRLVHDLLCGGQREEAMGAADELIFGAFPLRVRRKYNRLFRIALRDMREHRRRRNASPILDPSGMDGKT